MTARQFTPARGSERDMDCTPYGLLKTEKRAHHMNANLINYTAVRALQRVAAPVREQMALAAWADDQICPDGYHHEAQERAHDRAELAVAAKVASRFGIAAADLLEMEYIAEHIECERFMAAVLS